MSFEKHGFYNKKHKHAVNKTPVTTWWDPFVYPKNNILKFGTTLWKHPLNAIKYVYRVTCLRISN